MEKEPKFMSRIAIFLRCLMKELLNPVIYLVSLMVGALINLLQSGMIFYSWAPYVIPILIQILTRSWLSFRNRNNERLMSISSERDEPSFICDINGNFLVTSGRPAEYLKSEGITDLSSFFGGDSRADPPNLAEALKSGQVIEMESPVLNRIFAVRSRESIEGWMIWLIDVTDRQQLDRRLEGIDKFRQYILRDLETVAREEDIDERTAQLILSDGWRAVFIAMADNRNYEKATALIGYAFKIEEGEIVSSPAVRIEKESDAPVWRSLKDNNRIIARRSDFISDDEWEASYPLHPAVRSFLGLPYPENLINWHEQKYIVIAFDKRGSLTELDKQAFEGQVSIAHTVRSLIDLTRQTDQRFLQSVSGLSAASESSDESTGRHIQRVNVYAENLARHMGLEEETCRWLGQVSALHDIGKIAMPQIIKKPGKLNPDEYREMQMHSIEGFRILRQMRESQHIPEPRLVLAANIALNHHQNWDGSGYPGLIDRHGGQSMIRSRNKEDYAELRPLKGEEIPVEAIIVGLADKYDALRNARHYKPEFSHEKTMEILKQDDRSGKTGEEIFGAEVWMAFQSISYRFDEIYEDMRDA